MSWLLRLAIRSAWNRRFVLALVTLSIALATFLLLGMERIRADVRASFSQAVSGTDLIAGARTGSVQLLLYSVYRVGNATNNVKWSSVQAIAARPSVAWTIPLSLGDSHRGFPVVATSLAYFEHFRYGQRQPLALAQGKPFAGLFETVVGSEVAKKLAYPLGTSVVLSHGDGLMAANDHTDRPFKVVGILAATGTPVDRSVHISLEAMEALHAGLVPGMPMTARPMSAVPPAEDLTPRYVTAVLVGLKNRAQVFSTQRWISEFPGEPLMAVMPGVALDEMWEVVGVGERALLAMSVLVALVSLAGLVATIMAGLNERRREMAVLRALGASPRQVLALLSLEGALVTSCGVIAGVAACALAIGALRGWIQSQVGVNLSLRAPSETEWLVIGAALAAGWLASLLPGWRAYRLSLADGLSPRV